MANLGLWQGAARGTGTLARTAAGLLQQKVQQEQFAERTGLLKRQAEAQIATETLRQQEIQRRIDFLKKRAEQ